MATRKLVKSGLSSHVVSLPKEYLEEFNLKAGDRIHVERDGDRLILSPTEDASVEQRKKASKRVITTKNRPTADVNRDILEAYVHGTNEIIVKMEHPSQATWIKKSIQGLVALEVVQEDGTKIVAKDFLSYQHREMERTVRRNVHIVGSMMTDLERIENEPDIVSVIEKRDFEVNRIVFLTMRTLYAAAQDPLLAQRLKLHPLRIVRYWTVNNHIEKMGDACKILAKHMERVRTIRYDKERAAKIRKDLRKLFDNTFKQMQTDDRVLVDKNLDKRRVLLRELESFSRTVKSVDVASMLTGFYRLLAHINEVNKVYRYAFDYW